MNPTRSDPRLRALLIAIVVAILVLFGFGLWGAKQIVEQDQQKTEAVTAAVDTADTNKDAAEEACKQVEKLGRKCAVDTADLESGSEVVKEITIRGERGPGPSAAQIQVAVAQALPQALRDACGGTCAPAKPKDGVNGKDGAASTVPGPTGATGPQGEKGDSAPTVTDIQCSGGMAPQSFTFYFSDGTAETVDCVFLPELPEDP